MFNRTMDTYMYIHDFGKCSDSSQLFCSVLISFCKSVFMSIRFAACFLSLTSYCIDGHISYGIIKE